MPVLLHSIMGSSSTVESSLVALIGMILNVSVKRTSPVSTSVMVINAFGSFGADVHSTSKLEYSSKNAPTTNGFLQSVSSGSPSTMNFLIMLRNGA